MSERERNSTKPSIPIGLLSIWTSILLLSQLLTGCKPPKPTSQASVELASFFPAANSVPGWNISQKTVTYQHDTLFNLVDGQADSFFAYGFEQVAVQRYQNVADNVLNVEIWKLATSADAYGLFSAGRTGIPTAIGNEGDSDPGRRLAFWQNDYFVSLSAVKPLPDETLQAFAQAILDRLPAGGDRPALVDQLPGSGLDRQSILFFHEEMSIQMEIWLGGENILGLSQASNGVLGRYQLGPATVRLILVEYSNASQATKGLKALQAAAISDLLLSDAHANRLAAVFGNASASQAQTLIQEALK
jgi:hypothetical protein